MFSLATLLGGPCTCPDNNLYVLARKSRYSGQIRVFQKDIGFSDIYGPVFWWVLRGGLVPCLGVLFCFWLYSLQISDWPSHCRGRSILIASCGERGGIKRGLKGLFNFTYRIVIVIGGLTLFITRLGVASNRECQSCRGELRYVAVISCQFGWQRSPHLFTTQCFRILNELLLVTTPSCAIQVLL